ncbi:MAG: trigger factor, partial [Pseudomonadales bacterium]
MTVALPSEDIDSAVMERLQSLSKTTRINGFRPGKVPFKVVKKRYEPQVRSEVLGSMINRSYFDAVQQEKLRPAGQPDIVPGENSEDDSETGFSFVATFEVYPDFDPVFNDSIKVTRPLVSIEQSDIDEMLENLRKQRTEFTAVDREAQN